MNKFNQWSEKQTWYFTEIKGGVQAFASIQDVDLSIQKIITEEYMNKIKENKVEPMAP